MTDTVERKLPPIVLVGGSLTVALYGAFRVLRGAIRLIAGPHAALDVSDL